MTFPALQFYVGDWRKAADVQSHSYHDRGVWFELLCFMHVSEQRGKLIINGRPIPDESICRMLGLDKQVGSKTIQSLLDSGVASRCPETGALMSRRMVRDEKLRKVRAEAGKKGGNPILLKQKPTIPVNQIHEDEVEEPPLVGGGEGGRVFSVELPSGFPKSIAEAQTFLSPIVYQCEGKPARVVTQQFIADLWNEVVGRDYRDRQGQTVGKWLNYVSSVWSRKCQWEDRNPGKAWPENGSKPMSWAEISRIIEAKEKGVKELENRFSSEAPTGREWNNPEKRAECAALKKDIKALNNQLSDRWKSNGHSQRI